MKFQKKSKTNFGVDADYWRLASLNINWLGKEAIIILAAWISEQAFTSNCNPIDQKTFVIRATDFDDIFNQVPAKDRKEIDIMEEVLKFIQSDRQFKDAKLL